MNLLKKEKIPHKNSLLSKARVCNISPFFLYCLQYIKIYGNKIAFQQAFKYPNNKLNFRNHVGNRLTLMSHQCLDQTYVPLRQLQQHEKESYIGNKQEIVREAKVLRTSSCNQSTKKPCSPFKHLRQDFDAHGHHSYIANVRCHICSQCAENFDHINTVKQTREKKK